MSGVVSSGRSRLLILGASVRAMAESARRAGFDPIGIDLFGDLDLRAVADWRRIDGRDYPDGLEALAAEAPPAPWLYTGALENRPDLIERIARVRPLLGCGPSALRAVRDPVLLAETLRAAGLPALEVRLDPTGLPRDGSWLRKPIASAGGRAIRPFKSGLTDPSTPVYYQERAEGPCRSAQFLGRGRDGPTELFGVTAQFVGKPGSPFAYRGNLGPIPTHADLRESLGRIGSTIARSFEIRGLFGVDYRRSGGRVMTLEVNPRPTAAIEVLELATGWALLRDHVMACGYDTITGERSRCGAGTGWHAHPGRGSTAAAARITTWMGVPPGSEVESPSAGKSPLGAGNKPGGFGGCVGKAILFAPRAGEFVMGRLPDRREDGAKDYETAWLVPDVADVPDPGTVIDPGDPVLTVFAAAENPSECARRLAGQVRVWRRRLFGPGCTARWGDERGAR